MVTLRPMVTLFVFTVVLAPHARAQDITLDYFFWSPGQMASEQALITEFEQQHPNVRIRMQAQPPEQYWPRMSALAAANSLPDVFYMSSGFIDEWFERGLLANLQPYVDRLDLDNYYTAIFTTARYPDKESGDMYAFPVNWVGPVLYYNMDAFDAAGLDYPDDRWTWDDFLDAALALTVDENGDGTPDQYGYWVYGRYAQIEPWLYRNGGRLLNEARTRLAPNEAAIEALQFLTDLTRTHGVSPQPQAMEGVRQQDIFPLGIAAMWVDGSWNIDNIREVAQDSFRWGVARVPRGPDASDETDLAYTWPDMMAMSPNTQHPDAVWDFITFMTGETRDVSSYTGGSVPSFRATAESEAWLERDQQPANKEMVLELGNLPSTTSYTPGWSEWRGYAAAASGGMNGELDEVFNGRKDLAAATESFVQYGNSVLERYYPEP